MCGESGGRRSGSSPAEPGNEHTTGENTGQTQKGSEEGKPLTVLDFKFTILWLS